MAKIILSQAWTNYGPVNLSIHQAELVHILLIKPIHFFQFVAISIFPVYNAYCTVLRSTFSLCSSTHLHPFLVPNNALCTTLLDKNDYSKTTINPTAACCALILQRFQKLAKQWRCTVKSFCNR